MDLAAMATRIDEAEDLHICALGVARRLQMSAQRK
jgi:hypothetical protein